MNKLEKLVYDLLKSNPTLKGKVRDIYQSVFDLLPDKENFFTNDIIIKENHFFGFHDVNPVQNRYMLDNKLYIPLRMPSKYDELGVGFWNLDDDIYTEVDRTITWNYHKGCRLQWLGNSKEKFIYNYLVNRKLGSKIYSIHDKTFSELHFPIDSISPDSHYATTFSYGRLEKFMPGYGYAYGDNDYIGKRAPNETGLFIIDLNNDSAKLIISLKKLCEMSPNDSMINANHFVTHTEFSPDGQRIAFLHRWTYDDPNQRFSRLITCKLDGSDIHISPTSGMVSHYVWDSKHGILAYCQIDGIDGHFLFSDYTMLSYRRVAKNLNSDGHQSFIPDSDYFVTDTYPDRRRYANIYLVNIKTDETKLIVSAKSPKKYQTRDPYNNIACDLHPRITGDMLCFDSVHTGNRAICLMKID